jgi:hypothetical protein
MMMALVPALAAIGLGQLDPAILDPVDGSNMDAVGSNHFHMFLDATISHFSVLRGPV